MIYDRDIDRYDTDWSAGVAWTQLLCPQGQGQKMEARNTVDYDKVICSMSEGVAGLEQKDKEHTNLHRKEE